MPAPESLTKQCPQCGSGDVHWDSISVRPFCNECGYWPPINFGTAEDASKDWNERLERLTRESNKERVKHVVFVYRHKKTSRIAAYYLDSPGINAVKNSAEWVHLASLDPRAFIEAKWDVVCPSCASVFSLD